MVQTQNMMHPEAFQLPPPPSSKVSPLHILLKAILHFMRSLGLLLKLKFATPLCIQKGFLLGDGPRPLISCEGAENSRPAHWTLHAVHWMLHNTVLAIQQCVLCHLRD